ncbi:MAG: GNAT family N-acetyltransferase [Candidatus Thorarchaeota archaeon]
MVSDFKIVIEPAGDWTTYSHAWVSAMEHLYWYQENPVFDFNKDEELEEMRADFNQPNHLFLVARLEDNDEIVGVLGLRHRELVARIRRWEPAIVPEFQDTGISRALIQQALDYLTSMGIKSVGCLLKHPINSPESVDRILGVYSDVGFERSRPDAVDLVMSLEGIRQISNPPLGIQIETGENYTFEDLASITVKSFTSTPEEREIHGFDKTVTDYNQATALLQRMAEGFYGLAPEELRKIAVVDGTPAGFLGAFISKSKFKPLTGILGPMAVLPDFRRRGIASYLVNEVLTSLKNLGCRYAAVGTPLANTGAIDMYKKAGFNLACRIINLERAL